MPNGVLLVAYAPTSNDVGMMVDSSFKAGQTNSPGSGPSTRDTRYEVFRSSNDGATWEDTNQATISGISVGGNDVELNWGGWWESGGGFYSTVTGVISWTDPGMDQPWSAVTAKVSQLTSGLGPVGMHWSESARSGGSAANNFQGSALAVTADPVFTFVSTIFGTCGGTSENRLDLGTQINGGYHRGWHWQGYFTCSGVDEYVIQPARGGSVMGWDGQGGIGLSFQASDATGYPNYVGMSNTSASNIGPGGRAYTGYQHSVSSVNNFFATTWSNQVYISPNGGTNWNEITTTLPGPVDPTGSSPFVGGRILLTNLNSTKYADTRLIALTQDTVGATAKGTTRVWVYTDAPTAPVVQMSDNGVQASGFASCTGDTITFTITTPSVDAEGDPILYQWQSSMDGFTWANVGAPTAALTHTLSSVNTSTPTHWRVMASSSLNGVSLASTPSSAQTFTVNAGPGFSSVPGPLVACPGLDQTLTYGVSGPPSATYTISISLNGTALSIPSLHNSLGSTPGTLVTDGGGYGSFTVYLPGSLLVNNRGDGYLQDYAFSATISSN
jgi:hypothetical protein